MECTLLSWTYFAQTGMQCTDALPDFIISGNVNMINLIGEDSRRDEVREHIAFDAGKKSDCTIRFNSNVRWSTSSPGRFTRHSTSQYYCRVSSGASRHRCNQKTLNTFLKNISLMFVKSSNPKKYYRNISRRSIVATTKNLDTFVIGAWKYNPLIR